MDAKKTHVTTKWKHTSPLMRCRFDPKGRFAYSTAEDRSVQRWDLKTGKKTAFTAHEGWIWGLEPLPDGETLLTGGTDGRVNWWNVAGSEPRQIRSVEAHDGWVRFVTASQDGRYVASAGNDKKAKLWDAASGRLVREFAGHETQVYSTFFHPKERVLVSGDLNGKIRHWNLDTGELVRELEAKALHTYNRGQGVHYGGIRSIALSPDGKYLACSGLHKAPNPLGAVNEPLVVLFDWKTGKIANSCVGKMKGIAWRALFHPNGTLVASVGGSGGGALLFWKVGENQAFHTTKLPNTARDLDLHPDGLQVLTSHHDRHVRICRMAAKAPKASGTKK